MKPLPLEELYIKLAPVANPEHRPLLPSGMQQEIGHFNGFEVA